MIKQLDNGTGVPGLGSSVGDYLLNPVPLITVTTELVLHWSPHDLLSHWALDVHSRLYQFNILSILFVSRLNKKWENIPVRNVITAKITDIILKKKKPLRWIEVSYIPTMHIPCGFIVLHYRDNMPFAPSYTTRSHIILILKQYNTTLPKLVVVYESYPPKELAQSANHNNWMFVKIEPVIGDLKLHLQHKSKLYRLPL